MFMLIKIATTLLILSTGVLAPTNALEKVQETRVKYGYGLDHRAQPGVALVGVENCGLLGYKGLAIVEGVGSVPIYVVDCEQEKHKGQLRKRGLVADISKAELGHKRATLVLWRE